MEKKGAKNDEKSSSDHVERPGSGRRTLSLHRHQEEHTDALRQSIREEPVAGERETDREELTTRRDRQRERESGAGTSATWRQPRGEVGSCWEAEVGLRLCSASRASSQRQR